MRIFLFALFVFISFNLYSQSDSVSSKPEPRGFFIGLGIGGGNLRLSTNDTITSKFCTTIPNIKIGYRLNQRIAFFALLPGANYKYQNIDRGFEGVDLAAQYWIKPNWWVMGGGGITFDAPAFYTVKDPKTAGFYTGFPSVVFGTGYEIWHKGRFAFDIQYRFFTGKSVLPNGNRSGMANLIIAGFNWY